MKLCSRLLVLYCRNCPKDDKFRYLIPILRKLGATWTLVDGYASLESLCRVLINCNWTFFLSLTVEALQGKACQNSLLFGGVGQFEPRFQEKGTSLEDIFLVFRKLDTFCYLTVQTAPCYVQSFWHNTDVWQTNRQTDRQTDGIAIASTALAMRALRRAVQTVLNSDSVTPDRGAKYTRNRKIGDFQPITRAAT